MKNERLIRLEEDLKRAKVSFEIVQHPPIKTVEEGLKYLGIEAKDGVSTLVFKADGKFLVVFRRDDHYLDTEKIKKYLKVENLEMASAEEILDQTGGPKGATPMVTGLPSLMEETILEREFVYGGTGSFEHDLKIKPEDLKKTSKAKVGDFIDLMVRERKLQEKKAVHFRNIATDMMKKAGVTYKFVPLPEDLALDVAARVQFHGITLKQAVLTMVFKTEKGFIAAQRRADIKVNFKKLKELAGVSQLALASEEELAQMGCEPGVVPLVGLAIPYLVDKAVLEQKGIYGGSGEKLFALTLAASDLVKANHATVGDFCDPDEAAGRKKRVFSGSRPTGRLHLGNYLGAIKGYIELQNRNDLDCIYSVVDLHGITTPYDKLNFAKGVNEVVLDYLGAGLDPKKCHVMVQSAMRGEVLELAYYFATIFPVSRVEDLPTYKEKKAQHPDYVNVGLLYYPILMAADILFAKAELVPVGIDQEPHIELTREVARKFNSMFGDAFPEPKRFDTPGRYVPSLLGEGKMSKSVEGSYINLSDDFETIKNKLAKAVTDSGKGEKFPETGPAANLVTFVELFMGRDRAQQYRELYKVSGIKYQVLKDELAQVIYKELEPIQQRRKYFEAHPEEVEMILEEGKEYARKIANETLAEVREKMGLTQ